MTVGERIKKLRLAKNITQDELASKLNISRQSISKWENSINEPDIDTLKQLCLIFDCDVEDIIGYVRETPMPKSRAFKILLYVSISILIFSLLVSLGLIVFMPEKIPMHYDQNMVADSYGSKYEMFLVALTFLIPLFLIGLVYETDKYICDYDKFRLKKIFKEPSAELINNYKPSSSVALASLALGVTIVISVINLTFSFMVLTEIENYLINVIYLIISVFFGIVSIFASPIFNKNVNFIFGFRTRFALKSKENWTKLNMCQSISAFICSIALFIVSLVLKQEILIYFISLLIVSLFPASFYQIYLMHKEKIKSKK